MSRTVVDTSQSFIDHPLDQIENVLTAHNWVFERMNNDEIFVQVNGNNCTYRIFFIWQSDMNALQFCCQYDLTVASKDQNGLAKALMKINEQLWMGHFDVPADTQQPIFRHTCLLRGMDDASNAAHLEDLVDISLMLCEKNFPAFYVLSTDHEAVTQQDKATMDLALMAADGEA